MKKGYVTTCFSSRLTTEIRKSATPFTSEEVLLTISGCFNVGGGGGEGLGGGGRGWEGVEPPPPPPKLCLPHAVVYAWIIH